MIFNKNDPLAPLKLTIETDEQINTKNKIIQPLDKNALTETLKTLSGTKIKTLTISLMNTYTNNIHEQKIQQITKSVFPNIPISISSKIIPKIYKYERTKTTIINSYIKPIISNYIKNLKSELNRKMNKIQLHILHSNKNLTSANTTKTTPINLLMNNPTKKISNTI